MAVVAYAILVVAAIAASFVALLPAIIIGLAAAFLVFRAELRWAAAKLRAPATTALPQREGAIS